MTCPLVALPNECFSTYQHSFLLKRNRHSWESIGECQGCKSARTNAEIAYTPEPDIDASDMRHMRVNPADFLDNPEEGRKVGSGRKSKMTCKAGHSYKTHGTKRKDGGWRCRLCTRERKKAAYQARKAA